MSNARQVCDGWDAAVTTAAGDRVTLHFLREPTLAEIASALANYEAALAAAGVQVECEDGTYA